MKHIAKPNTATQIRKTLGITKADIKIAEGAISYCFKEKTLKRKKG
jgi:hypothetical protein